MAIIKYRKDASSPWQHLIPMEDGEYKERVEALEARCDELEMLVRKSQSLLAFELSEDGTAYTVTGIGDETATDIVIPDRFLGKPVTAIARQAFSGNTNITSVTIPDSVKSLGYLSFYNCTNLTRVVIGSGVESISTYSTFGGCPSLSNIEVSENNLYFSSRDGSLYNKDQTTLILWAVDETVSEYAVPDFVTKMVDGAFINGPKFTSIIIRDNVKSISSYALIGCKDAHIYVSWSSTDARYKYASWGAEHCIITHSYTE